MEQVRNLPLMNFPRSALPTAPGVSRTNKVCKRFPEQKGTPHSDIEETFRESGYIPEMPIREVCKDGDSESEKEREVHMEKKLFHYEVRLSKTESRMLHNNAHLAGMPCSEYLRTLIKGFVPKQMPNKDFHDVLQRLNKICLELSEEQNPKLVREIRKTVKQLQELYLNMDSVCTIQFEKGGDAE